MKRLVLLLLLSTAAWACGNERVAVKNLADPAASKVNQKAQLASIADLSALKAPKWGDSLPRQKAEMATYRVTAQLKGYKHEADGDYHLVIADNGKTMVAEIPDPDCVDADLAPFAKDARGFVDALGAPPAGGKMRLLKKAVWVDVEGPAFFDKLHGQTGAAKNGIEIHPVMHIQKLDAPDVHGDVAERF